MKRNRSCCKYILVKGVEDSFLDLLCYHKTSIVFGLASGSIGFTTVQSMVHHDNAYLYLRGILLY